MASWGSSIAVRNLFAPCWEQVKPDQKVDVVIDLTSVANGVGLASVFPGKQLVRIVGAAKLAVGRHTLLNALVKQSSPNVTLWIDDGCKVLSHLPMDFARLSLSVEVCAGLGASSVGLELAGFKHACAVEHKPRLAELHQIIHPSTPVFVCDVGSVEAVVRIWDCVNNPGVLLAGISCQPYSRGGRLGGGDDARSQTLPAVLSLAHKLQVVALIIECVELASSNNFVRQHIQCLIDELGFQVSDCHLKLQDVWAANRHRWWLVATKPEFGRVVIPPVPRVPQVLVRDLIPYTKKWEQEDELQLELTDQELAVFRKDGPVHRLTVRRDNKLPTALHSWGNQALACPCQCRDRPFSAETLERGVFAQVLPIHDVEADTLRYRHLHPSEVALCNGLPCPKAWHADTRLSLCGVGQLASPLQSVWVGSCLMKQFQSLFSFDLLVDPVERLCFLRNQLYQQAHQLFPTIPAPPLSCPTSLTKVPALVTPVVEVVPKPLPDAEAPPLSGFSELPAPLTIHDLADQQVFCIRLSQPTKVRDLIAVEAQFRAISGSTLTFFERAANVPLGLDALLTNGQEVELRTLASVPATALDFETAPWTPTELDDARDAPAPSCTGCIPSAFASLRAHQLQALLPPLVVDLHGCDHMRQQVVPLAERLAVLDNQDLLWGDDEIFWHLDLKLVQTELSQAYLVDPLLVTGWFRSNELDPVRRWCTCIGDAKRLVSCILVDGHWIPCFWSIRHDILCAHIWEHVDTDIDVLLPLHAALAKAFGLSGYEVLCSRRSFGLSVCGAAAIAYIQSMLLDADLPRNEQELMTIHTMCKAQFRAHVQESSAASKPWCWGAGPADVHTLVASLLQLHGVPANQCDNRTKLIVQSLGADEVRKAVQGGTPWKSLKALANLQKPAIQLVLPDEQQAHQQRQQPKTGKKKSTGPPRASQAVAHLDIDPSKLHLETGMFRVLDDQPISQLTVGQISPLSVGIALATVAEAAPFLQANKLLTHQGLALLVVNPPDELPTKLQWAHIRFAAQITLTKEPVLLTGALVQLGKTTVYQFTNRDGPSVHTKDVACARLVAFRDMLESSWDDFCTQPVRTMFALLPPLHVCNESACHCVKWHPQQADDPRDVVCDVFRRQFYNDSGKPVKAAAATHYAVMIRFLLCQQDALLRCSGANGVFIEPRTADAASPSADYQVVWLSTDFAATQHAAQVEPLSIGLARNALKFGIRVAAQSYQQVFAALKPDSLFLAPGKRCNFLCGPWPFGTERKALDKIFRSWGWQARPLQPSTAIHGGSMWLIQAITEPAQNMYCMQHGTVVISKCSTDTPAAGPVNETFVPRHARALCQPSEPASGTDPWLQNDPWKHSLIKTPTPAKQAPPVVSTDQLQALEARIQQAVLDKLPAERMEVDSQSQESRLATLENQMQEMAQRHQSLAHTVQEHHQQNVAQVQTLQSQMMTQLEVQGRDLQRMLDDQTAKIEAVLSKKGRFE